VSPSVAQTEVIFFFFFFWYWGLNPEHFTTWALRLSILAELLCLRNFTSPVLFYLLV
jgi:hypothetical protein